MDAGAGAGGSSWGCGGDVSWVDMVVIISNGLSILWMLVLLIFGGRTELVNQGRRLGSMIMQKRRSQSTAALHSLDNPLSRPGSMGDIELSEASLAIELQLPSGTETTLLDTGNSETALTETASTAPLNRAASVQAMVKALIVASADLDSVVASKATALMEQIDTFLLEGTQNTSRGQPRGKADQEEGVEEEKLPASLADASSPSAFLRDLDSLAEEAHAVQQTEAGQLPMGKGRKHAPSVHDFDLR